jgi:hypothetical protein
MKKLTLEQAKLEYKPQEIFKISLNNRLYSVYEIENYEHENGKWNNCSANRWLDYSEYTDYISEKTSETIESFINTLIPFIDIGINRICFEIRFKQNNYVKYKWDDYSIRGTGSCEIYANNKLIYKFVSSNINYALSKAQILQVELLEHPYNFLNPELENGRKIWYYGLPAIIKNSSHVGEIHVIPDYSYIKKNDWWENFKNKRSNILPEDYKKDEDEELDTYEELHTYRDWLYEDIINHGDILYDKMIDWYRK